jgi:hypothetical protein
MAAKMAMMAMTTSSSISVKAPRPGELTRIRWCLTASARSPRTRATLFVAAARRLTAALPANSNRSQLASETQRLRCVRDGVDETGGTDFMVVELLSSGLLNYLSKLFYILTLAQVSPRPAFFRPLKILRTRSQSADQWSGLFRPRENPAAQSKAR